MKNGSMTRKPMSGLSTRGHAISLAFAVTDFKLQGKSVDVLILSLAPRNFNPPFYLHSLYVLLSRVRTRAGLRVLSLPSNWDHLKKIRHNPSLEIWERSYPQGRFDRTEAGIVAGEVAARLAQAAKETKRLQAEKKAAEKQQTKAAAQAAKRARRVQAGTKAAMHKEQCPAVSKKHERIAAEAKAYTAEQAEASAALQAKRQAKKRLLLTVSPGQRAPKRRRAPSPNKAASPKMPQQPRAPKRRASPDSGAARKRLHQQRRNSNAGSGSALQSVIWRDNSCPVDTSGKAVELGKRAVVELTGLALDEGYFPPLVLPRGSPTSGSVPTAADVGGPLKRWLHTADQLALSMDVAEQRVGLGFLNMHRDALRTELNRSGLLSKHSISEENVAAQLRRLASAEGASIVALKRLLRVDNEADAVRHEWMGGSGPCHCGSCSARCTISGALDRRVHDLPSALLRANGGDPLLAFAARYCCLTPLEMQQCEACGSNQVFEDPWLTEASTQPGSPLLLALHWNVDPYGAVRAVDSGEDADEPLQAEVVLAPDRLDEAQLTTPFGEFIFRLVALIYYNGSHYITVGRTEAVTTDEGSVQQIRVLNTNQWVCWDAMRNRGKGCILDAPPTACRPGPLIPSSQEEVWNGYRAETAIYCRIPRVVAGDALPPRAINLP
jgi:hypothetical protein